MSLNMDTIEQLCDACIKGDDQQVRSLLATNVDINTADKEGYTPLHMAMAYNHPSTVGLLLARPQLQLEKTDRDGWTGLHLACYNNSTACISLYGEDRRCTEEIINMKTDDGSTAVMYAVVQGYLECVKEMDKLEGVDFTTKNCEGQTLIEVARLSPLSDHYQIVQFLEMRVTRGERRCADGARGGAQTEGTGTQNERRGAQADRRGAQADRRGAQAGSNAPHVATNSLSLREIADELASIEEIDAVMILERDSLNEKHVEETERLKQNQEKEANELKSRQQQEIQEIERNISLNKARQDDLKQRMNDHLNSSASTALPSTSHTPS